jgi:hypothetical protein
MMSNSLSTRSQSNALGRLSGFIVPVESRRTELWEPGSREGSRRVLVLRLGHRSKTRAWRTCTRNNLKGRQPLMLHLTNRMREICSYGSVGEPVGNRRLYPDNKQSLSVMFIVDSAEKPS